MTHIFLFLLANVILIFNRCHIGWSLACLPSQHLGAIRFQLAQHSRNPDFVRLCMQALIKHGEDAEFLGHALKYLEPTNAYSDVIRMAVVEAMPPTWPKFTLVTFQALRLALTDDDEDVRLCALDKTSSAIGTMGLSLARTLELLYLHAHQHLQDEFAIWRNESLRCLESKAPDTAILFAAEPLNLFVSPYWEREIIPS